MTKTDNPRELRAAAQRVEMECDTIIRHGLDAMPAEDQADTIALINDRLALAGHILATVRDDDGEEQPSRKVSGKNIMGEVNVCVARDPTGVRVEVDVNNWDGIMLVYRTFTRGQFRALCRGLGITPEEK